MEEAGGSMEGKVCLVTGATSGIGKVTAHELAKQGATVVIVGRSRQKVEATVEEINSRTGNQSVEYLLADLSSQKEIRSLAREFKSRYDRLDVLVNNAGAVFAEYGETEDGVERTFAVNHLNYFLLTNLLLDVLEASAPSRIVNVASGAHQGAELDFDDLGAKQNYGFMRAYGRSKLANIMFTYELARRLEGTGVTANALHPGSVATGIGTNNDVWYVRPALALFRLLSTTPEKGAKTSVYLASSPEIEGVTGQYFANKKSISSSKASYDEETAKRLWRVSEELTGLSEEETA
jgi:NAD(P)-dependent dehydrogenase (short-subunit alcohol dehydrogenase family)